MRTRKFLAVLLALSLAVCTMATTVTVAMASGPDTYVIGLKEWETFTLYDLNHNLPSVLEVKVGESLELAIYEVADSDAMLDELSEYDIIYNLSNKEVSWSLDEYYTKFATISDAGVLTAIKSDLGEDREIWVKAKIAGDSTTWQKIIKIIDAGSASDNNSPADTDIDKPTGGTTQNSTAKPSTTTTTKEKEPRDDSNRIAQETAMDAIRDANNGKSSSKVVTAATAAGTSVSVVPVKLYGLNAAITRDNMEVLASGSTGLKVDLDNGAAQLLIPAEFTMPQDGVLAYYLGHQLDPLYSNILKAKVKEPDAKSEVHLLGGGELPTTATVTIKTKVKGTVNVYCWNEETRKISFLTTSTAENGKVTFATKQLGNLIITTGTI